MLQRLRAEYKVRTVACEGGATSFRALLARGLIDQLNLTIAPFLFGGVNAPLNRLEQRIFTCGSSMQVDRYACGGKRMFPHLRIKHSRRKKIGNQRSEPSCRFRLRFPFP